MLKLLILAITLALTGSSAHSALTDADRAEVTFKNLLADRNPGFEAGKAKWTASGGTFTTATSGANFMGIGKSTGTWDSSAAAQTLTSAAVTVANGYAGTNGLFRCKVMTPSGTATHTMGLWDGSTLTQTVSIPSSTTAQYVEIQAPFGAAATTVAIRFTSVNANEPLISIDDCYIGPNINIGSISQAIFVGESYFAGTASCVWSRASATVGAFSTSATCPGPTIVKSYDGAWQTTDVDLPIQTINNLPPGVYEATFQTRIANSAGAAVLAINDGTTTCEAVNSNDDTTFNNGNTVTCVFEYTTAGSHAFQLYGASTGGTINVNNTLASAPRASVKFSLRRSPNTAQMAVRADNSDFDWTPYTPTFVGFGTVTNINIRHRRVGANDEIMGFFTVGTPTGVGATISLPSGLTAASNLRSPELVGHAVHDASSGGLTYSLLGKPSDTVLYMAIQAASAGQAGLLPNLGNIVALTSDNFSINASVPIQGWTVNQRTPLLVGSVTSATTGMLRIESATVSAASPGVPSNMSSPWISGNCPITGSTIFTCPITAGTFSGTPNCIVTTAQDSTINVAILPTTTSSSLVVRAGYLSTTGGVNISAWNVICMGPR